MFFDIALTAADRRRHRAACPGVAGRRRCTASSPSSNKSAASQQPCLPILVAPAACSARHRGEPFAAAHWRRQLKLSKAWLYGVLALGVLALQACGGSSTGDAQVRVVNATRSHAAIDLSLNGAVDVADIPRNAASPYTSVSASTLNFEVTDSGAETALASAAITLTKSQAYALLVYEDNGVVKTSWIGETNAAPPAGTAGVHVLNLAPDAGAVDVYVTAPGVPLAGAGAPSFTLAASAGPTATPVLPVAAGSFELRVTAGGSPTDIRADIPSLTLAAGQVVDVVLTPTIGGGLIDAATLVQQGDYAATPNTHARVRLAAGVDGGQVVAALNGVPLEPGAVSPFVGNYVTVPAGSATGTVTVAGNAAAVPPIMLAPGGDDTMLIVGTPATAVVTVLGDDNHAPASTGNVELRLVDGTSGSAAGLSLTADFALVQQNVLPGSAGAYAAVAGDTGMQLQVSSPLSSTPVYQAAALNIPAGGVYSVFVLGDAASPTTIVRKDR